MLYLNVSDVPIICDPDYLKPLQSPGSEPRPRPISVHGRLARIRPMRPGREPRAAQKPRTGRIARRGAIAAQHEPVGLEQGRLEIDGDAADVEGGAEGVGVREIGRDDEARRLRVQEGEVGVADGGGGDVGDLGRGGDGGDGAGGGGGESHVLLEPDEVGGDGGAQVCGRVDDDGDVAEARVEGDAGAEGWGVGWDWGLNLMEWLEGKGEECERTFIWEGFSGFHGDAAIFETEGVVGLSQCVAGRCLCEDAADETRRRGE